MFYQDSDHIYRVRPLEQFAWLRHGFGTRHATRLPADSHLATLHQIHSDRCIAARGRTGSLGDGDALLEDTPGHFIAVKTADCIPLLLVDAEHRAVAAVHAGWRGTAQSIAQRALEAMAGEFGTRPAQVHAAIGPGIGECCYQVGPEVSEIFGGKGPGFLDLSAINRGQLLRAGIPDAQIYAAGLCTKCGEQDFHSFRRDKERSGRMLSFAGIVSDAD